ncbi:MAG: hypothetical protein WKF58_11360 [Ilumatobacteraceae bacterium]
MRKIWSEYKDFINQGDVDHHRRRFGDGAVLQGRSSMPSSTASSRRSSRW